MAVASWASSGVVQPIADYWKYDEQIYTSTLRSGADCPALIAANQAYATEQAALRLDGQANAIDPIIKGTNAEGMHTDDFMAYVGDFASGSVQYGQRVDMCSYLTSIMSPEKKPSDYWTEIIAAQ